MTDSLRAETVRFTGHGGDEIEAYLAQPLDEGRYGGVVVIHHMPGYDEGNEGDHAEIRGARLPRHLPESLQPGGAGSLPGRRLGDRPGARRRARRSARRRRRRRHRPPQDRSSPRTAASPRSVTARVAGSRSWLRAAFRSTQPWTATAPSSSALRPQACRSRSARSCTWRRTSPARCSACSVPRTSTRHREQVAELEAGPEAGRQDVRVPQLRGRRPRLLLDRPSELPTRGRQRRLAADLGFLRPVPGVRRQSERKQRMCTYQTEKVECQGIRERTGGLVLALERHGLLRPPGALPRRAQLEHRLSQP